MTPAALLLALAAAAPPAYADPAPKRYDLSRRASELDPRAREHPALGYTFADKAGKPQDVQFAAVDTRVAPRGQLVVWLMGRPPALFDRLAGYGLHAIQVHYANKWYGLVPKDKLNDGTTLGKIRLEAATGDDVSPWADVPKPDSVAERAHQFVRWLAKTHPQGRWDQFLAPDGSGLNWEKVILSGASHGSTTAARFAKHQRVARVVMLCGPRDQYDSWQALPSATPAERFFGFSHVLDSGWTGKHYCRSWELLGLPRFGPVVDVDSAKPPYGNTRRLVTSCDVKGSADKAHGAVTPGGGAVKGADGKYLHEPVWEYLYTHPVGAVGSPAANDPACVVKPAP